ncbi:MAG: sarcosine oxidase subunit gamma [Geminicoccaceae bacterium]
MADVVSPLDNHLAAGRPGHGEQPAVSLSEVREHTLFQLAAWPETIAQTGEVAAQTLGLSAIPGPGQVTTGSNGTLMRVEPLKWWLVAEGSTASAPAAILPEEGNFLDLSHSRTWLKVSGKKAEVLLNHFLPIDLREGSFPTGSVASTAFHHIGVTLWRAEDDINLLLPRSFAASLWQMLCESAMQYGVAVRAYRKKER